MWWKWKKNSRQKSVVPGSVRATVRCKPRPTSVDPLRIYLEGLEEARGTRMGRGAGNEDGKGRGERGLKDARRTRIGRAAEMYIEEDGW